MNWAELSYELGRVVLVRDFIGPSGLVRVVFGPSCPAPTETTHPILFSGGRDTVPEINQVC